MARTNPTDVKATFDTELSDAQVSDWINIANEIVDRVAKADSSLPSTLLEKMEKLLAQGYAAMQDPRIESGRRESAQVSYQRSDDMPNDYFAAAATLDTTGVIENLFKPQAGLSVLDSRGIDGDIR